MHRMGGGVSGLLLGTLMWPGMAASAERPGLLPGEGDYRTVRCESLAVPDAPGVECGRLDVPERHGKRKTVRLSLPVVVLRRTGSPGPSDALLYLHGGPGIATLEIVGAWLESPNVARFRQDRDLVLFDQRGTGKSTPAICPDFDAALDKLASEAPGATIEVPKRQAAAAACRRSMEQRGRDPDAYSATAIAQDAEALRRALGYRQWNLLPTSFGSLPALELARHYPTSVRSIIFNSAFPPNSKHRAEQFSTTAEGLEALQKRCNEDAACRSAHPDIQADLGKAVARFDQAPLDTQSGRINGSVLLATTWNLLVGGTTAAYVPVFVKRAAAGDEATVRKIAAPFAGPHTFGTVSHAQKWLVECRDIYPRPAAEWVRQAKKAHPALAQDIVPEESDLVCDALQPASAPAEFFSTRPVDVPALVYAGEFDPATPTSDAEAAMKLLANGTMIPVSGASHAAMNTDECTRSIALSFLAQPAVAPDTGCLARRPAPVFPDEESFDEFLETI